MTTADFARLAAGHPELLERFLQSAKEAEAKAAAEAESARKAAEGPWRTGRPRTGTPKPRRDVLVISFPIQEANLRVKVLAAAKKAQCDLSGFVRQLLAEKLS